MLAISQQAFGEQLANEYGVEYGRSVSMPVGTKLGIFDKNEAPGGWPFLGLVGSLMWLSTQTRPDISNAVRAVARNCAAPKLVHWRTSLGILGYVRRTSSLVITFQRCTLRGLSMQVFADADYSSQAADRRLVSEGVGGACVSWFSWPQKCVTLVMTEAEYVALPDVMKEVLFMRQVWRFMLPDVGMPARATIEVYLFLAKTFSE